MSKKTRKKTPEKSARKAAKTPAGQAAKTPVKKAAKKTAGKSPGKTIKKTVAGSAKASTKNTSAKKNTSANKAPSKPSTPHPAAKTAVKPPPKPAPKAPVQTAKSPEPQASHASESKAPKAKPPVGAKSGAVSKSGAALAEGAKAPAFDLPRDGGDHVSLGDYAGRKLVLFFYPRADTPGCTREAIDFTRLGSEFERAGAAVLGVSADPVKAQESFRTKHQLSVPLVSDEQHQMLEAYGAWGEKSMYGKTFMGIIRTTVLIGANGMIARIWRHVRVDGHADEVLAAAKAL